MTEGFWRKTGNALLKSRSYFSSGFDRIFTRKAKIDGETLDSLEELLIGADLGVRLSQQIISDIKTSLDKKETIHLDILREKISASLLEIFERLPSKNPLPKPAVSLFVGVNGVGKTTSIGKIAHRLKSEGQKVLVAAADTFRAGAANQLAVWGERAGVDVIRHHGDADPSAVAYDAVSAAKARGMDRVLIDSAGRLQTQHNLMEELKKMTRVISKQIPQAPHEKILVLDATTGQNAYSQAEHFQKAIGLTGIVLTKLDGTGKGGMVIPLVEMLSVPVLYIGVGEGMEDLVPFDPVAFVSGLFA